MNNVAGGHMSCLRGSFKVPKSTDYQKKSGKVFDKRDANPCNEGNAQARKCKSEDHGFKSRSRQRSFSLEISIEVCWNILH